LARQTASSPSAARRYLGLSHARSQLYRPSHAVGWIVTSRPWAASSRAIIAPSAPILCMKYDLSVFQLKPNTSRRCPGRRQPSTASAPAVREITHAAQRHVRCSQIFRESNAQTSGALLLARHTV